MFDNMPAAAASGPDTAIVEYRCEAAQIANN
jgi:hypothetical protein